jgi:hypothetical protein
VVAFCIAAIGGYAVFSVYAVVYAKDATMMGDVIGTWKSFAVLAFGYWIGSSSGGKSRDNEAGHANPTPVEVTNDLKNPVPTTDEAKPDG